MTKEMVSQDPQAARLLQGLHDADFGWVQSLESVWSDAGADDAGPNREAADRLIRELSTLAGTPGTPGRVLVGQAGIGKTHLVGVLRRRAWAAGSWFVMLDVIGITDFWASAALSFVTSLMQEMPGGRRQHEAVLSGVARRFKVEKEVEIAFATPNIEAKAIVNLLIGGLMRSHPADALRYRDVFRALALLRAHDVATIGLAHAWLQGFDADPELRQKLGFASAPPAPAQIVQGLLWVMGLAGPTLIAVDQIDGVITPGSAAMDSAFGAPPNFTALLCGGLLQLATSSGRSLLVLTCLLSTWELIKSEGPAPLSQRFMPPVPLRLPEEGAFIRRLIAARLAPAYARAGVASPDPAWPFTPEAIASAAGTTPRLILMRCDDHRRVCLARDEVIACRTLDGTGNVVPPPPPPRLDGEYAAAQAAAVPDGLLDPADDGKLGALLRDAFDLYARQIPADPDYDVASEADAVQKTPPLHGRLVFTDHRANDRQKHVCFRALQHANAVALCARFRAALTASGIASGVASRQLIVVRRGLPPTGPTTRALFANFIKAGGIVVDPSDSDLRAFLALRQMRDDALAASRYDAFERWLVERKPLCDTALFRAAGLCPPPLPPWDGVKREDAAATSAPAVPAPPVNEVHGAAAPQSGKGATAVVAATAGEAPAAVDAPPPAPQPAAAAIPVGRRLAGGEPVELATRLLPMHTAIIAGAGSGKTVLLRRIVEEAALAGIPAIVIDPNNDLARLGDPWPERPASFTDEDAARAERYRQSVEVVVWTPGVQAGNPLFLSVLPDFAAVGDDPDERAQAVTMAAETLGPLADARTNLKKGVLSDALRAFSTKGGTLAEMIAFLEDLPDGVSTIGKAASHAAKMADEIKASIATNPLLKAGGPVVDPAVLFSGASGRTRVSVVNLAGLASEAARQDFVNRLQMTLFGWIKKHPSRTGRLYVIDEVQLFIPSGTGALSKLSGVQLVAQGRKYGLGMVAVTQQPRGIDNKVVSNCTTQFLGKQNSPTDQASVKQMIAATGGAADDVGRLGNGEFYFKTEKSGKPFRLKTPLCLSHHPSNPPTPEEVAERARACADALDAERTALPRQSPPGAHIGGDTSPPAALPPPPRVA